MNTILRVKSIAAIIIAALLLTAGGQALAQGQSQGKKAEKQEQKKLDKEARKLESTAEEAAQGIGRDAVFCILAAHTTDVGTAQQLKDKFNTLTDFPFGQFVSAVLLADRSDLTLAEILTKLQAGMSIGQITKEAGENMGEVRSHFGQFRSELARSTTNPPTRDCFSTTP
ncbi:MAG TPA: hypothetical protein VGV87_11630 [Blastocatellia bacterium]|nr:hypothetical protein [Blastocatellia bacterium]